MGTENRLVAARGRRWGVGRVGAGAKMSEGGQKLLTSSYEINKSWGCNNVQHGDNS